MCPKVGTLTFTKSWLTRLNIDRGGRSEVLSWLKEIALLPIIKAYRFHIV